MTGCIVAHSIEDVWVCFDAPEERVARRTERTANRSGGVAVVHEKLTFDSTDQASAVLRFLQGFNVIRSEAVLALVAGAQILGLCGIRISPPPCAKSRVALLAVGCAVLTVTKTRALPALTSAESPIRERIVRESALTLTAPSHTSTVPRSTDMQALDQPCHADVLLELANQEVHQ